MPREYKRTDRVADFVRRELAILLQREMRDPRVKRASISDVVISRDMSLAKVYVSFLQLNNDEESTAHRQAVDVLNGAAGFLRTQLASKNSMRSTPRLQFYFDETARSGEKLDKLIEQAIATNRESGSDE